jgi:hypothetical protein
MNPAIFLTTRLLSQAPHVALDFNSMGSGDWKGKRFNEIVPARAIVRVVRVTESGFARDADRTGEQADYDALLASLECLKPPGLMVSFGNASGEIPALDIGILSQKGSLYRSRPTLATYTAARADLEATAREVFDVIRSVKVKVESGHTLRLAGAVQAHRDPEGRKTVGSIVMVPRSVETRPNAGYLPGPGCRRPPRTYRARHVSDPRASVAPRPPIVLRGQPSWSTEP